MRSHLVVLALAIGLMVPIVQQEPRPGLTIDHRIDEATSGQSFTDIRGIAVNPKGDVFVLDEKTQDVRMFDARGKFLRRITRRGKGPGELIGANGLLMTSDGGFVVNDVDNGRLTVWTSAGVYVRQIPQVSDYRAWLWEAGWDAQSRIVERTTAHKPTGGFESQLRRIRFSDGRMDTLPEPGCVPAGLPRVTAYSGPRNTGPGMMIPFLAFQRKTLDRAGNLWCSPGDSYRIDRYRIGTTTPVETLRRDVAADPVSKAERDSVVAIVDSINRRWAKGNADPALIPMNKPIIEGLTVDAKGRLWVKRAGTPALPTRYDVWLGGRMIGKIESSLRLAREVPIVVVGDLLYGIALDDDDVQSIIVAKIVL